MRLEAVFPWRVALVAALLVVPAAAQASGHRRSITIHAGTNPDGSYYLKADRITVETGQELSVTLVNDDYPENATAAPEDPDKQHDVVIKGVEGPKVGGECPAVPGSKKEEEEGEKKIELEACTQRTATANFTAPGDPTKLEFEMECEVPGHAEGGMKGVLVVEQSGLLGVPGPGLGAALAAVGAAALLGTRRDP